jgi:thiamine pyrophosphokinase
MAGTVVIVAGAAATLPGPLPAGTTVIGADAGAELALAGGLRPDLAVGDFDSITPAGLAALERAGVELERHPVAKDETDLELALEAALRRGPERILVVADAGGRLDHLLGGLLVLAAERYAAVRVDAQLGPAAVHVVRGERTLRGEPGELVSLFAVAGPAEGVTTEGLAYPLAGETLRPGSTRGVSNAFAAAEARVAVERGVLLAVRPTGSAAAGSRRRRRNRPGPAA